MKRAAHWLGTFLLAMGTAAATARPARGSPFVLNANHPIIVDGQLFGGSKNTRWLTRESFPKTRKGKTVVPEPGEPVPVESSLLLGQETLRVYGVQGFVGAALASKLRYGRDDANLERYDVTLRPLGGEPVPPAWRVAVNGEWNAMPRPFREVKPQRLFVGDLDGDGKDERVRVQPAANGGKGSTVGQAREPAASLSLIFEMNGKAARLTAIDLDDVTTGWQLLAIDCDGDGKMELLLTTSGRAASAELYEIRQGKPVLVVATPPD